MVSIGKLAAGQADYYLQQAKGRVDRQRSVSSGVEDYYLGGPEAAGVWMGLGARTLALVGTVDDQGLRRILAGRSPATGELLPRRELRVPGFDITFSAPKSVSLLFGLGDAAVQSAVGDAHESAVRAAFGYLERQAAFSRRGHNGTELVAGEGLVAAAFRHRTSRAGDPQLHTHVLVANLTRSGDGAWRSLDGRRLYAHARTAGFLYEFRLRAELTQRLGVAWEEPRNGIADIRGIARPVLRAFSRRRAEIEAELARVGLDGAAAAQVAALETRRRKDYDITPEELVPEWRERASRLGLDPASISSTVLHRTVPTPALDEASHGELVEHLASSEGMTHSTSTFTRKDGIQAWCEQLPLGADVSVTELEAEVDRMLASPTFVPILNAGAQTGDAIRRRDGRLVVAAGSERRYSTPELLATEQRIIAEAAQPAQAPTADPRAVEVVVDERGALADEQATMVRRLTLDPCRVALVVGKAGAGKTFALDAAREAWERSGVTVLGAAVARRAARELEEGAGIVSTSVAALLADLRRGGAYGLRPRSVVVVDEASLLPTRQLAELLGHVVSADGKLVLVGDHRQLPAIQAGGAFRGLALRIGAIELVENRRQTAGWERAALDLLRDGHAGEALRTYAVHDRLVVGEDAVALRQALVGDWWRATGQGDSIMIAFRRADVGDLNERARVLLASAGRLGSTVLSLPEGKFAAGDHVVLRRNDHRLGVANGDRGRVLEVDPRATRLVVAIRDRRVELDHRYLRPDGPRAAVQHGYAVTGHIAQGMTVDQAFVLGTDTLFQEWGYVSLSRGRIANRFYAVAGGPIDRDEFAPETARDDPFEEVVKALGRSRAEFLATDAGWALELASATTESLQAEAARLRAAGGASALAAARRLREVRLALAQSAASSDTLHSRRRRWPRRMSHVQVETDLATSRCAALRDEAHRLEATLADKDLSAAARLSLMQEELARRDRLNGAAQSLEPGAEVLKALGSRPERPVQLRFWRRQVMRFSSRRARGGIHRALDHGNEVPRDAERDVV